MWPGSIWKALPPSTPPSRPTVRPMLRGTPPTPRSVGWSFWQTACWPGGLPHRVDPRWCYRGVAEVSIYVGERFRGKGLGSQLLNALCADAEKEGYWTLQSTVLQDNTASRALHTKCGFRLVGRRERIARDCHGRWLDTYLMERRAKADEPEGIKKL